MDPTKELAKAEMISRKTDEVRRNFALPDTEIVIQDYHCSIWRTAVYVQGRIWLTQNYVLFQGLGIQEVMAYRKMIEVKKERTQLVLEGISIALGPDKTEYFSNFVHRDEAYELIYYLWKHPVVYVTVETSSSVGSMAESSSYRGPTAPMPSSGPSGPPSIWQQQAGRVDGAGGATGGSGGGGGGGGGAGGGFTPVGGGKAQQNVQVDTQTAKNLVRIANETKQVALTTNNELARQAEVIDHIEYNIESIHANQDLADRYLKGIHSIGGAISNAMDSKLPKGPGRFESVDRTIVVAEKTLPDVDYEILYKQPDDSFLPAFLRFSKDTWACIRADTKQPIPTAFSYDTVQSIVCRARPQHLDIRFKGAQDKKNRVRLFTSELQFICNEMYLRTKAAAEVIFELGVKKFDYISQGQQSHLRSLSPKSATPANAFLRTQVQDKYKAANLISDENKKQDMLKVDAALDEVSDIVGDLARIAAAQSQELDRSKEQLERVNKRTDEALIRAQKQNAAIRREIRDN